MTRAILASLVCVLLLAGCGQPNYHAGYRGSPAAYAVAHIGADQSALPADQFAYGHTLALEMGRDAISPRYERAKQRCLKDASLRCKLLSASINSGSDEAYDYANAQLFVSMPHDSIPRFEQGLLDPVSGEGKGDVTVTSRSTTAENAGQEASDVDQKIAQLSSYRDRLTELQKRPGLSVDDLIKIESELAKVESDLDPLLAQKRDVNDRIQREQLTVSFSERAGASDAWQPIRFALANSIQTLGNSTGSAIQFLIGAIPWLPIVGIAFLLTRWGWRSFRRRGSTQAS
jgi:hypothetical protein